MINLIINTLWLRRKTILYYSLGALGVLVLYMAIYPSVQSQMDVINKLLDTYPPALMKAFNFQANAFSTVGGYLSTENYGVFWPLLLMFMVVSFCASTVAGEIENGTMGLLLSLPISRGRVYLAKYLAVVVSIIVFVLLSVITISPVASIFALGVGFANVAKLALMGLLLGLAVAGLTFFFSSIFSEKGRVTAVVGGVLVLMYVLNLAASLKDSLSFLKYVSFFHYFEPAAVLQNGTLSATAITVFFGVAIVFAVLGLAAFTKRDITV